jgi:hypothetical protein
MNIKDKLAARRQQFDPNNAEHVRNRQWFADHEGIDLAYSFYDNHIESMESYQARMTSRTAQLLSITYDGFPVIISRNMYRD